MRRRHLEERPRLLVTPFRTDTHRAVRVRHRVPIGRKAVRVELKNRKAPPNRRNRASADTKHLRKIEGPVPLVIDHRDTPRILPAPRHTIAKRRSSRQGFVNSEVLHEAQEKLPQESVSSGPDTGAMPAAERRYDAGEAPPGAELERPNQAEKALSEPKIRTPLAARTSGSKINFERSGPMGSEDLRRRESMLGSKSKRRAVSRRVKPKKSKTGRISESENQGYAGEHNPLRARRPRIRRPLRESDRTRR